MFLAETDVFNTPEEFEASFQGGQMNGLVLTKPGRFEATLTRLKIGRVWAQRCSENLERSLNFEASDRFPIQFFEDDRTTRYTENGEEVGTDYLLQHRPNSTHFSRTFGPCRWASMSLHASDLEDASHLVADRKVTEFLSDSKVVKPSSAGLARLRRVHRAAGRLVVLNGSSAEMANVVHFIEQDLIVAMVGCLASGAAENLRAPHRRKSIMDSFRDWLEHNLDRPVHVLEACKVLNVPARTLNLCCHEYLGMGPKQYLMLRRIRLARKALLVADESTTVTSVAIGLGFWDLSRFAAFYHDAFDELPSTTLHRAGRKQTSVRSTSADAARGRRAS